MDHKFFISNVSVKDLCKDIHGGIHTGLGFLDHMIEQFDSHAQVGVSIQVCRQAKRELCLTDSKNQHATPTEGQGNLMSQVGEALGKAIHQLLTQKYPPASRDDDEITIKTSRFCCPLDEALVECVLSFQPKDPEYGKLESFTLAPYGIFPIKTGRTCIGKMMTAYVEVFFASLAKGSNLSIQLFKVRGNNGHHIVESAFKAFSRALRNLLDGTDTTWLEDKKNGSDKNEEEKRMQTEHMWGLQSISHMESLQKMRGGSLRRSTKETSIDVDLKLDGGTYGVTIDTGIQTLNGFFTDLAREAMISLSVLCKGDLWVDEHHSAEDVSIAVGKLLNDALGNKVGLNRMWCATASVGDAFVEVVMDLSNRPCLTHNLSLDGNASGYEYIGDLSIEMFAHVLDSFVMNGQMTVHILQKCGDFVNVQDLLTATAIALGRSLRYCIAVDPRRTGVASSKGTLSA